MLNAALLCLMISDLENSLAMACLLAMHRPYDCEF